VPRVASSGGRRASVDGVDCGDVDDGAVSVWAGGVGVVVSGACCAKLTLDESDTNAAIEIIVFIFWSSSRLCEEHANLRMVARLSEIIRERVSARGNVVEACSCTAGIGYVELEKIAGW
jgi:hypothetical protein